MLEILPRIWSYSKWITVGNLLSLFAGRLEVYLLTAFASASEVAIYGVAFKLSGGLLFLQTNIRTVLFPELARRAGSRSDVIRSQGGVAIRDSRGTVVGCGPARDPTH